MTTMVTDRRLDAGSDYNVEDKDGNKATVKIFARYEVYNLQDSVIQVAIESREILKKDNVVVKITDSQGKANYVVYTALTAVTLEGMKALADNRIDLHLDEDGQPARGESVASYFNYGRDLDAKRLVRGKFLAANADPGKMISKGVKILMDLGYSQAEAEELAKARTPTA